jgi:hypothetical protein
MEQHRVARQFWPLSSRSCFHLSGPLRAAFSSNHLGCRSQSLRLLVVGLLEWENTVPVQAIAKLGFECVEFAAVPVSVGIGDLDVLASEPLRFELAFKSVEVAVCVDEIVFVEDEQVGVTGAADPYLSPSVVREEIVIFIEEVQDLYVAAGNSLVAPEPWTGVVLETLRTTSTNSGSERSDASVPSSRGESRPPPIRSRFGPVVR